MFKMNLTVSAIEDELQILFAVEQQIMWIFIFRNY